MSILPCYVCDKCAEAFHLEDKERYVSHLKEHAFQNIHRRKWNKSVKNNIKIINEMQKKGIDGFDSLLKYDVLTMKNIANYTENQHVLFRNDYYLVDISKLFLPDFIDKKVYVRDGMVNIQYSFDQALDYKISEIERKFSSYIFYVYVDLEKSTITIKTDNAWCDKKGKLYKDISRLLATDKLKNG